MALGVGQTGAVRDRFAERGGLPFRLGREPALGPIAPGLRLVPVDERHRRMRGELLDLAVASPGPAAAVVLHPVDRPFGRRAFAPGPARGAPEFAMPIPTGIN